MKDKRCKNCDAIIISDTWNDDEYDRFCSDDCRCEWDYSGCFWDEDEKRSVYDPT